MSTIHFVGGEKGGVGKSVVAHLLAQLFIDRELPFAQGTAHASICLTTGLIIRRSVFRVARWNE